eukprot:29062-Pelagococcus_subviridis.AAC.2
MNAMHEWGALFRAGRAHPQRVEDAFLAVDSVERLAPSRPVVLPLPVRGRRRRAARPRRLRAHLRQSRLQRFRLRGLPRPVHAIDGVRGPISGDARAGDAPARLALRSRDDASPRAGAVETSRRGGRGGRGAGGDASRRGDARGRGHGIRSDDGGSAAEITARGFLLRRRQGRRQRRARHASARLRSLPDDACECSVARACRFWPRAGVGARDDGGVSRRKKKIGRVIRNTPSGQLKGVAIER